MNIKIQICYGKQSSEYETLSDSEEKNNISKDAFDN